MTHSRICSLTRLSVSRLIAQDLACAGSDADLRRRLARHGYGFADMPRRRVLVTLPHGVEVMDLPRPMAHA